VSTMSDLADTACRPGPVRVELTAATTQMLVGARLHDARQTGPRCASNGRASHASTQGIDLVAFRCASSAGNDRHALSTAAAMIRFYADRPSTACRNSTPSLHKRLISVRSILVRGRQDPQQFGDGCLRWPWRRCSDVSTTGKLENVFANRPPDTMLATKTSSHRRDRRASCLGW